MGGCLGGLCGVAFGPLFGYPVVLGSVGQVLGGDASHQGVRCNDRSALASADQQSTHGSKASVLRYVNDSNQANVCFG